MDRRLVIAACVAAVLLTTLSYGADVKIIIHPALQGYKYLDPPGVDHPVITSATHNSKQLMEQLEITNYGHKTVTEVTYGWRIAGAAKCPGHTFPAKWGTKTEKVIIPPGKAVALYPPPMLATNEYLHQIINQADLAGAHAVVVTVGILKATYADGTAWEDKDAGLKNQFDGGIAETVESCTPPTTTSSRPKCGGKFKDVLFDSHALDQCWPAPARGCTGRQILSGDCPWEDCVIVGCGYLCDLTWTMCEGAWLPLNCNTVGQ